jgi:Helix-turn-helix
MISLGYYRVVKEVTAAAIREIRRSLELTQKEFANALGVSQITVARWESGDRKCRPDFAGRILQLKRQAQATRPMKTISEIDSTVLAALNSKEAVAVFRDLLWCEVRRLSLPLTTVDICLREVADGGIDATVTGILSSPSDVLESGTTCFQIKSGTSAKPAQRAWLKKELFGASTKRTIRANLAEGIAHCLENHGTYILACFGVDCTPQETRKAKATLYDLFSECGFADARFDVWSQGHLVGLFSRFYSLCLAMHGRQDLRFQSHSSWRLSNEMSRDLHLADRQKRFVDQIRDLLRGDQVRHIRVTGEPGVGKSRLVLEALSAEDLAPAVVYVSAADDFQNSQLFNFLLRPDGDYFLILVLDECQPVDCSSIWDSLRNRSDRCRIVSIDHDWYQTHDEWMQVLECPRLPPEQITTIIEDHAGQRLDSYHWADFCSGSPRVAHLVGENLRVSADDILQAPSTVQVWERFIAGYRPIDAPETKHKRLVLRHLALFYRFGFELGVDEEARFIARLVQQCDPTLTWGKFQSIVDELKRDRVLQGGATLFIAPKALHVYLWEEFWQHHGRVEDLSGLVSDLPGRLETWFFEMFRYAHRSEVASRQAELLLSADGPFSSCNIAQLRRAFRFILYLSQGVPGASLDWIERTIGQLDYEAIAGLQSHLASLVSALKNISVWPSFFSRAASILLKLGAAETDDHRANAKGAFAALFSMAPGDWAPTGAPPQERLPVLQSALTSTSPRVREVGLQACRAALDAETGGIFLTNLQGLRAQLPRWTPKTWGEVHGALKSVWDLLFEKSRTWPKEARVQANSVLIDGFEKLVQIDSLSSHIVDTIEALLDDDATSVKEVVAAVTGLRQYPGTHLSGDARSRLEKLDARIAGADFVSRLRRYVLFSSWDDYYGRRETGEPTLDDRLSQLADEALSNEDSLNSELSTLVTDDNKAVYPFGFHLCKKDSRGKVLEKVLDAYRKVGAQGQSALLLGGFLTAIYKRNVAEWESLVASIIDDPAFSKIAGATIQCSGLTDNAVNYFVSAIEAGKLEPESLLVLRCVPNELSRLDDSTVKRVLGPLIAMDEVSAGLEIAHFAYCYEGRKRKLPRDLTRLLLTKRDKPGKSERHLGYTWSEVAKQYITDFPDQGVSLFESVVREIVEEGRIPDSHDYAYSVIEQIIRSSPKECWDIVARQLEDEGTGKWRMRMWLAAAPSMGSENLAGPLILFPIGLVLEWIDRDPSARAPQIAAAVPKSLDANGVGAVTREILNRYGDSRDVREAVWRSFYSSGWSGSASVHYRGKRDEARKWLQTETSFNVRTWIDEYIGSLNESIKREENRELHDEYA